ncbi:Zinc finger CCCH domain-containing protein 13 [Nymphon striatum]|nr:Zinc finger CCCH domain-containing protein 13 [Nymphon striatum]
MTREQPSCMTSPDYVTWEKTILLCLWLLVLVCVLTTESDSFVSIYPVLFLTKMSQTRPFQFEPKYATDEEGEESLSSSQSNRKDDEKASRIVSDESKKKNEAVTPNADNFDYDPISDDELEAMIEEPAEADPNETSSAEAKKSGIVDSLNVDWASLMGNNDRSVDKPAKTKATQQFKAGKIFSRIGFSVALVTSEVAKQIKNVCQEEMQKDFKETDGKQNIKFELKHDVAALHAAAISQKEERDQILTNIGSYRRALCARQDLQIRRKLCRFHHRLPDHLSSAINITQQNTDPELYQMSVRLFKNATRKSETVF